MPGFVSTFFTIFFVIFVGMIIFAIARTHDLRKQNNTPIKKFSLDGKNYLIYSKQTYNRYYNNQVIYELRDSNQMIIGTFNSLNDILVLLNIDQFPSEDIFL